MKHAVVFIYLALCTLSLKGQDESLLSGLPETPAVNHATNAFKSPRVIMGHSMEMLPAGTLDFRILHRFGFLDQGLYDFFGLDKATMRLSFDYGILPNLTVGVGRGNFKKEVDGFVKYRLLWQSSGARTVPLSVVWVSGMTVNGLRDVTGDPALATTFSRRLGYYHQLVLGRKFSERFTLQLTPTYLHQNLVENEFKPNDLYALGFGGRFKITRRIAVVWDYFHAFNRFPARLWNNPVGIGFDIETGGHVFQLHFSNATGMNERAFLSDSNGDWRHGEIRFGFNLSRVFQLKRQSLN